MTVQQKLPSRSVDWTEIRRRMELVELALSGREDMPPERIREVLKERARTLARPAALPVGGTVEVVTFALANEVYAIESRYVVEVFRLHDLSPLPGARPPTFGVTAWRGEVLTIFDLRSVLALPVAALNDLDWVVVLGEERPAFGILADAVRGIATLTASGIGPPSEGLAVNRDYLRGVTSDAVLVLDAQKLLTISVGT